MDADSQEQENTATSSAHPVGTTVDGHSAAIGSLLDNYCVDGTTLQAGYPLDMCYVGLAKHYFMLCSAKTPVVYIKLLVEIMQVAYYAGIRDEDKVEIEMSGHSAK